VLEGGVDVRERGLWVIDEKCTQGEKKGRTWQ